MKTISKKKVETKKAKPAAKSPTEQTIAATAAKAATTTKRSLCLALLRRPSGATAKDLLAATDWPAISVPATTKGQGKLRKEKKKGEPTVYFLSAAKEAD